MVSGQRVAEPSQAAHRGWVAILALATAGIVAYLNSFQGVFVFDDWGVINGAAMHASQAPWGFFRSARPLSDLLFVANYAIHRQDVWGYHAVNLLIHLMAGVALLALAHRILLAPRLQGRYAAAAPGLAFTIAILWLVHPLQTQSVTFIAQRAESLMGLFYLLTLYCVARVASASSPAIWGACAILACALGMASKTIMITAPLIALLCDAVFFTGSVVKSLRAWPWLYLGLAACLSLPVVLSATEAPVAAEPSVGFALKSVTALDYARSQPGVLLHYLRLALWPSSLVLDYDWPVARGFWAVVPPSLIIGALGAVTIWKLARGAPLGFLGAWFFLILAPTSSFYPIADLAVEHRMYLPLVAVVSVVVVGGWELFRHVVSDRSIRQAWTICLVAGLVISLMAVTIRRNADYRSAIVMWSDVVAKRPGNPRALNSLGGALAEEGRNRDAIPYYVEAIRLKPNFTQAHSNLGAALARLHRLDEAITHYREAMRLDPDFAGTYNNLGAAFYEKGNMDEAVSSYRKAVELKSDFAEAHYNLALALAKQGKFSEAIEHYETVLRLDMNFPDVQRKLEETRAAQNAREIGRAP